jgi:protein SCO1/2
VLKRRIIIFILLVTTISAFAAQRYPAKGMILLIDRAHNSFTASCQAIPGFMKAMSMPFDVRSSADFGWARTGVHCRVHAGSGRTNLIRRTCNASSLYFRRTGSLGGSRIEAACESHKQEQAGAKSFVDRTASSEFTLTDQSHHQISLVQFAGKVVAVNFIYTSCALPNYCFVSPITLECFSDGSKTS